MLSLEVEREPNLEVNVDINVSLDVELVVDIRIDRVATEPALSVSRRVPSPVPGHRPGDFRYAHLIASNFHDEPVRTDASAGLGESFYYKSLQRAQFFDG